MRWNHFSGSVLYAAVAALGLPAAWHLLGPMLGGAAALALYWTAVTALYAYGIAPGRGWRRRSCGLAAAGAVAAVGLAASVTGGSMGLTVAASTATLGIVRSGWLYVGRPMRALLLETALGLLAVLLWSLAIGTSSPFRPGPVALAFGVWSWGLIQSAFFLAGGVRVRQTPRAEDPFERAHRHAAALLEEDPV